MAAFTRYGTSGPYAARSTPPSSGPSSQVRLSVAWNSEFARARSARVDEVRHPRVGRRAEEAVREPDHERERHDRACTGREGQRHERREPDEVGADHQPAPREAVDERPEQQADRNRRDEVGDEQRAHPGAGLGALVDVDRERDDGEHRPDTGAERREEEEPERRRAAEKAGTDHAAAARTCARASAKIAVSSGVPTLTRIAPGAPKAASGRTITPSRRSASKSGRASSPTSA